MTMTLIGVQPHQPQIRGHDHGGSRKYDEGHEGDDDDSDLMMKMMIALRYIRR